MARSTKNMELVPQEVLNELMALDVQLDKTKSNLLEILKPVVDINNELQKSATSYRTLTDLINKQNQVEAKAIAELEKHRDTIKQMKILQDKLISSQSQQAKEIEMLRSILEERKKYNDEIQKSVIAKQKEFEESTKSADGIKQEGIAYKEMASAANKIIGLRSQNISSLIKEQAALSSVKAELSKLNRIENEGKELTEEQVARKRELINSEKEHKQIISGLNQVIQNDIKLNQAASGSMNEMAQSLSKARIAYRNLTEEERNSPFGQELLKSIQKTDSKIKEFDASIGNHQRNVGNYAGGFNTLQYSVQQVARELPSLTMSLSQFFLAISNNVPILSDEIIKAKNANAALRAEGKKGIPVWRQLISSVFSWQTALVVGITVITAYGKEISNFFKSLFGAKQALIEVSEVSRLFGENIAKDTIELDVMIEKLKNTTKGTEDYNKARMKIIDKYGDYLKGQKDEIRNLEDLDAAYKILTQSIIQNSIQKGLQDANSKMIEEYNKGMESALDGVLKKFEKKYGKEKGIEKFMTFKIGLTSDDKELRDAAEEIYREFNERTIGARTNELNNAWISINKINEKLKETQKTISIMENSYRKVFGADTVKESDSLLKKQQDLRKETELLPESTEEEIILKNRRLKQIDDEIKRLKELGIETDKQAKSREKEEKKIHDYIIKLQEKERNAYNQMLSLKEKEGSEANKRIVQDERFSYEERIEALNKYSEALKASVKTNANAQIEKLVRETTIGLGKDPDNEKDRLEVAQKVSNQVLLIRQKEALEIEKITEQSAKTQVQIEEDRLKKILKSIQEEAEARGRDVSGKESAEYDYLAKDYKKGLMSEEVYQSKRKAISDKYALIRFDEEQKMLEQQLNTLGLKEEEKNDIQKRLADGRLEYEKWVNEQEIAAAEALAEKKKELLQDVFNFGQQLIEQRFQNQLNALDEESEANDEWSEREKERIDRLEEAGAISKEQADARKAVVDDQAAAREDQIENKRKEILRKQAIYEKAMAIAQIAWNTAQAIMAAWTNPWSAPGMIPLIIAAGAVQSATVLATPIPEYAQGTEDHPGGLAIVGDGGKSEMIIAGGKVFRTPSTDTLVDLPPHSVVLPDFNAEMNAMKAPDMPMNDRVISFEELSVLLKEGNQKTDALLKMFRQNIKNELYARELNKVNRITR
nr:MAG TPA: tail tape measure protein [Caudoviricetes sp.]